jgi:hypothetical protein
MQRIATNGGKIQLDSGIRTSNGWVMLDGDSLSELLKSVQLHALAHHEFTQEELESPDRIAIWEGAIK